MKFKKFFEGLESRFSYKELEKNFADWMESKHGSSFRVGTFGMSNKQVKAKSKRLFKSAWNMGVQIHFDNRDKIIFKDRNGKELEWDFLGVNTRTDHPDFEDINAKEMKNMLKQNGLDTRPIKPRRKVKSRPELPLEQFLQEKREIIGGVEYFINPTPQQVSSLTKKWGEARFMWNQETDEFIMWNAYDATHEQSYRNFFGKSASSSMEGQIEIEDGDMNAYIMNNTVGLSQARKVTSRYMSKINDVYFS